MSNVTIVQQARSGTVKPLLASRIKSIVSQKDLKHLLEIQARADTAWNEQLEFAKAPRLIEEARAALKDHATAENRERLDALVEKYGTAEHCGAEEGIRYSHLAQIEREVPVAVEPVLRRVLAALCDVRDEMADADRKAFEHVGLTYIDGADASPILLMVIEVAHFLGETLAGIRLGRSICAESPSAAFARFFDLASVKKEGLALTLPVIRDETEPVVISPREQAFRDSLVNPPPLIDRATSKPVKPLVPGIDFPGHGPGQETFNSDGAFSRQMATVAPLPRR